MSSSREIIKENHNHNIDDDTDSIKDEQVRRDIRVLSARLTDMKERFMNIVQKINEDAVGYIDQTSDEDGTSADDSNVETTVNQKDNDSNETSNIDDDDDDSEEDQTNKSPMRIRMSQLLIESIIERQTRHNGNKPSRTKISLRHVDSFIKEHVDKNPTEKIYDEVSNEIQVIRQKYLKNRK
ncbi:unnamed protein product [Adineta ricciae]|uniref:Uncharacterized protein n=1 Tax=Adineta ricciae TaxID=249248 RepID=A0A813P6N6_ADIRI|nr:unnamed protein product [Adineta ricciae]